MMITPAHLDQFSEKLSRIIREEAEKGNPVVETSQGWPEPRTILIFLGQPFTADYRHICPVFREVNDPHYWKSEYFDRQTGHILACKYGDSF